MHLPEAAGESSAFGWGFVPQAGVYDLRRVKQVLQRSRVRSTSSFEAAFSRSTGSLIRRGVLEPLRLVPIASVCLAGRQWRVLRLANGDCLRWRSRQVRFVRWSQK
jgi:hypothetical protein